jgi:predicted DNA-binding WGR domain protein
MSIDYKFIGWCTEENHDKVWACIQLNGDSWRGAYATVWGRRGKKLQHKVHTETSLWDMEKLIEKKCDKGYDKVSESKLNHIYPEFKDDLEATTLWAMLKV